MTTATVLSDAAILAGIVGLVEVAVTSGMPRQYSPLLAILIGIGYAFAAVLESHGTLADGAVVAGTITTGIGYGLLAVGAHASTTKTAVPAAKRHAERRRTRKHPAA